MAGEKTKAGHLTSQALYFTCVLVLLDYPAEFFKDTAELMEKRIANPCFTAESG